MKKSKFLKRASALALAALMTTGVALTVAACGGDDDRGGGGGGNVGANGYMTGTPGASKDDNILQVSLFCNDADTATNQQICNEWMAKYNEAHGTNHQVQVNATTDKGKYFNDLDQNWSNNNIADIIYLAPRFVRSYAETGRVLNIADYLDTISANPKLSGEDAKKLNQESFGQIWKNSLSYYSYIRGRASGDNAYTMGQPVTYNANDNRFRTDSGNEEVGLYGLPKDYSSFSTGYNKNFFTEEMKEALTTTAPNTMRTVNGAKGEGTGEFVSERVYTNKSGLLEWDGTKGVVQYAVDGEYTNPYTGEKQTAKKGEIAPIINIGVPTTYYPFNFFRFNTYYDALEDKDPVAMLCNEYTNGEGYTVTIPGFPNDTFTVTDSKDPNAPYDSSMGHIVYTYAEYSALIWAMTYYLNTFDWQPVVGGTADNYGGVPVTAGGKTEHRVIYGGEQYEGTAGATGSVLYLLPWLFGNDADLIDATSKRAVSIRDGKAVELDATKINIDNPADWENVAGNYTNPVTKMNLDGTTRQADVQFGYNSQNLIETYGAFLALASDWNANDTGDTDESVDNNGWSWFRGGRCLFYGAGSWDAATRNDSDPVDLTFGQMPTPISEDYALYSKIKGANYEIRTYSNGATSKGTGNGANNDKVQRTNLDDGLKIYDAAAIVANQTLRQDKWGARMDSVGYAVNGQVSNYTGNAAWKIEAAVSLVMALTIDRDAQATLTYSGAQFPNFMDQMQQFVDYQKYGDKGAFKDMLTPEGFSDMKYYNDNGTVNETVAAEAKTLWDKYYDVARDMARAAINGDSRTVEQFLSDAKYSDIKYNKAYKDNILKNFTGDGDARLAYSMKVLNMVALSKPDREINLRMQYGLNAVRDSTMYTYTDSWIGIVDARTYPTSMFAYRQQGVLTGTTSVKAIVKTNPAGSSRTFMTPAVFCFQLSRDVQTELVNAITKENDLLSRYQNK